MTRQLRAGALAAALASTLLLAACAPQASAGGAVTSPTPIASQAPSPGEQADPLAEVAAVVVRPEALELVDGAGAIVATLSYDMAADDLVSDLNTVFGAEPVVTDLPGGTEAVPRRVFEWHGFTVTDDFPDGEDPVELNVWITAELPVVGDGVAVRTVDGFAPGDDLVAYAAAHGLDFPAGTAGELPVEFGPELDVQSEWSDFPNANAVKIFNHQPRDAGVGDPGSISAPWNFGIGHV